MKIVTKLSSTPKASLEPGGLWKPNSNSSMTYMLVHNEYTDMWAMVDLSNGEAQEEFNTPEEATEDMEHVIKATTITIS